jgi:hypothetical protein
MPHASAGPIGLLAPSPLAALLRVMHSSYRLAVGAIPLISLGIQGRRPTAGAPALAP